MPPAKRIIVDTRDVLLAMLRIKPALLVTIPAILVMGMLLFPVATVVVLVVLLSLFAWQIQTNPHAQRRLAADRERRRHSEG